MTSFDPKRFTLVLKLDLIEGGKSMLSAAACMLLLYLFFFWFAHNVIFDELYFYEIADETERKAQLARSICEAVTGFSLCAMLIFFCFGASALFRKEQKKQSRIAWLMLPASNLEKFCSRWIFLMVYSMVGGVVTFVLADLIHLVWLEADGMPIMTATHMAISFLLQENTKLDFLHTIALYTGILSVHAFFLLGGVLFRKRHFIATSLSFVVLSVLWGSIYNGLGLRDLPSQSAGTGMTWLSICLLLGLTALFTWTAYRLFCRWQVVSRKMVNV